MMMVCASPEVVEANRIPAVVVVDPRFDEYKQLAASARQGRLQLHFRSSGAEALKLAKRLEVDAWLIASDLDDMSGQDLATFLDRQRYGDTKLVAVGPVGGDFADKSPAPGGANAVPDAALVHPISFADLEELLGLSVKDRAKAFDIETVARGVATLPVGVGAAGFAIALLLMG